MDKPNQGEATSEDEESSNWVPSIITETSKPFVNFFSDGKLAMDWQLLLLNASPTPNDDTIVAFQWQLGWQWQSGVGVRAEYLRIDQDWELRSTDGRVGAAISGDIANYLPYYSGSYLIGRDLDSVHWDIYRLLQRGKLSVLIGGGLSMFNYREKYKHVFDTGVPGAAFEFDVQREYFTGLGAGVVTELRRPLYERETSGVNIVCNGRSFVVPGELNTRSSFPEQTVGDTVWVNKGATGLEYYKKFRKCTFKLRGLAEAQHWNSDTLNLESLTGGSINCDFYY